MKLLFSIALLLSLHTFSFAQYQKNATPNIERVTVFLNQAQIESSYAGNLTAGSTKIVLDNIANTIDSNSIQVGGQGDFTLLGVKYKPNFLNAKASVLKDSIDMVKSDIENLDMLLNVALNEERMIMANASIKSEKDGVLPEDLKEMIEFFRTKLTEVGARKLQITRQIEPLKDKKARLEKQLSQDPSLRMPLGQIELSVSAVKNTNAKISITYIARNAGWSPNYDIRVKDTNSPVNLTYKASVYQNTGIDWKNVKLSLSTSNPSQSGQKPEVYPQYLSFYQPNMIRAMRKSNDGVAMALESAPMADMATAANIVEMVETSMSVNFEIQVPYNILSGVGPELVEVRNYSANAAYNNIAAPKFDNASFLTADILEWEKLKLLSGEANVYFMEKFLGKTYINESSVDNKLTVSLGRDNGINTKREELEKYNSRKTFGSNVKESFGYKITIKNTKNVAVDLIVEDQVPVSQDSDIEVSFDGSEGATLDAATGKLKWTINLAPGANKEIEFGYTVKYPKDKRINNL
jgi:uncharacterized protein (TIGR02231 family)